MTQPAQTTRNSQMSSSSQQPHSLQPSDHVLPPPAIPEPSNDNNRTIPEGVNPDPEPPPENLAQALELLAKMIGSISGSKRISAIKPRVPDVFDGTNPSKLETFIFQCSMYMSTCSGDFPDSESQVTFALSYLKGNPLDWFQMELNDSVATGGDLPLPPWFTSYSEFLSELKRLFGPQDPVTDAMTFLEMLQYKDSTKATRYTIDFNRYGRRTGWDEQALSRQYYRGLPDRLKDEIARIGKPTGLKPLQDLVATLDQRYWERKSEIGRDKKFTPAYESISASSATKPPTSGAFRLTSRLSSASEKHSEDSAENSTENSENIPDSPRQAPSSGASSGAFSGASAPGFVLITGLLGPDGRLKPEERKRRMDNGLCLRCGKPGHMVNNCPGTSGPAPNQANAAASASATDSDSDSISTSDSDYIPSASASASDSGSAPEPDSNFNSSDSDSISAPDSALSEPESISTAESASDAESM
jgi:hypothetical protein